MKVPGRRFIFIPVAVVVVLALALVPVVPYTITVYTPSPFPYKQQGVQACQQEFEKNNVIDESLPAYQHCIAQYLIRPVNATGYGSVSFSLLGIGLQPFPQTLFVGETGFYALLHMSGSKISVAEEVQGLDAVYNPPGITISNSSISWGYLGNDSVTITVTNHSGQTLVNPWVFISAPGETGNFTDKNGTAWMFSVDSPAELTFNPCLVNGNQHNLTSGAACVAVLNPSVSATIGSSFRYSVEVRGYLGSQYSITRQGFSSLLSMQTADQIWVNTFVKFVNTERGISPLVESPTLDRFAALRFSTAVSKPDISDYGLYGDEATFFGANATKLALVEILLYPNLPVVDPFPYANLIQESAPGHWAALTDQNYTHFGYFVGTGLYEVVKQPCPVFEIPRAGINITQFFESAGCSVSMQQATWLVMILGS